MINQISLGNKNFPVNIIQGPLAGYSNAPFRLLTWRYSQPAYSCTEMISSKALIYQSKLATHRYVKRDPQEGPVCFQLSGNDASELSIASKIVEDLGADLIDLNCGCPVRKIRRKGMGSSLLTTPSELYKLIRGLKQNTSLPVSIKIRVEGDSDEKFNSEIAKVVKEAGVDFLIVHGRHWTENYETPCRYDEIKFFVNELDIPVIGNGDISCVSSLRKMYETGCAGVMIGRAGVGQPWLIKKLIAEMNNEEFKTPPLKEIGNIFLEHVNSLAQLFGNIKFSIVQARKLAKYYGRGVKNKIDLITAVNDCDNLVSLEKLVTDFFVD